MEKQILELIRGLVRPTMTWIGFAALTGVVIWLVVVKNKEPADWYISLVTLMVGYWFGQRKPSG